MCVSGGTLHQETRSLYFAIWGSFYGAKRLFDALGGPFKHLLLPDYSQHRHIMSLNVENNSTFNINTFWVIHWRINCRIYLAHDEIKLWIRLTGKNWLGYFSVLYRHSPWGTEENHDTINLECRRPTSNQVHSATRTVLCVMLSLVSFVETVNE